MSYNGGYGYGNRSGYNNGQRNYGNNYNNNGNNYNNNGYNQRPKKRSGSKTGTGKNKVPFINGWNASRKGFLTIISCPANEPHVSMTKNGHGKELKAGWERWVVSAEFKANGGYTREKSTHTGFYNTTTRKLYIPDFGMVANPHAPNGGYFGTSKRPKR